MSMYKPTVKTGEYEELREKFNRLVELGFKPQKVIESTGLSYNAIYDWLRGRRNLNHEAAPLVEKALQDLKMEVNNIL